MKPMSPQLSLAAVASALALAALCLQTPAVVAGSGTSVGAPAAAMAGIDTPGFGMPSLLPR